jgi:N-acetylneuraminate synthase
MTLNKVFIVAEAGVNHNGSLEMAKALVDAAVASGADAVKFQTFKTEKLVSKNAQTADYQKKSGETGTQAEMLKKLELSESHHEELIRYCRVKGIRFLSTPFDLESLDLLADKLGLDSIKVSSGDLTNGPLLLEIARKNCSTILSTGMSTLKEVEQALGVLAFGYLKKDVPVTKTDFEKAYNDKKGKDRLLEKVTLLHCVTNYPAPFNEVNLRAMKTMEEAFGLPVGFSDHTLGIAVPIAAVALGARVIEKHFTLDKSLPGPDHRASLEPHELKSMVESIRQIESAMGDSKKAPSSSELKVAAVARKSIVASKAISKGEIFTEDNLTTKRPSDGVSPMQYWEYVGTKASRDYNQDEMVDP